MTDIVPVENLYIGAPHRSTQIPTAPQRTPHRPVDGQLVDERWSASTQQRAIEEAATAAAHQDGLMQVLCGQVASATKLGFVSVALLFEGISTTINQTL